MNDTIIISTISRTYSIIVSFFIFIFLVLFTSFIVLQNGLIVDNLSLPNLKIEQLYIKWNEKIDISAKNIAISSKQNQNSLELKPKKIRSYITLLSRYNNMFNTITIKKITIDKLTATLRYRDNEKGFLQIKSPQFTLDSDILSNKKILNLHVKNFQSLTNNLQLNGDFYFDSKNVELSANLNINVNNDINASLFFQTQNNILRYRLKNNHKITSITYLMNHINLPKEVKFWALDAIDMDFVTIESAKGFIDFKDTQSALKNLHVKATVHGLNYTYNKELDAIHTKTTNLEFKKGVLYIRPNNPYSYGMFLNKSWLKIDFNPKEELLTLYLLFDGMLNKNMLKVLNAYKIKLPYLQKKGTVKTNLSLAVGLRNIKINAKGNFIVKKALFNYLGLDLNVYKADIQLNDYNVDISNMLLAYKNFATSKVSATYNANKGVGTVNFNVTKVTLPQKKLSLVSKPLKIIYKISPNTDIINIKKSNWKYNTTNININAIKIPFNLDSLILNIPTTNFRVGNIARGLIKGTIDLHSMKASLKSNILKFKYKNIKLNGSNSQLHITYDKKFQISSKKIISLSVGDLDIHLRNAAIELDANKLYVKDTYLSINNVLYTKLNSIYNKNIAINTLNLSHLLIKKENYTIYKKNNLKLNIEQRNKITSVSADEISTQFTFGKDNWKIKIDSLEKIEKNSPTLQNFKIKKGNLLVTQENKTNHINIQALLDYDYKLLMTHNRPVKKYTINGFINDDMAKFYINNSLTINMNENMDITMHDCGLNIPELLRLRNDITLNTQETNQTKILLHADNFYFQISNTRKIIADTLELQHNNTSTTAQLTHAHGTSDFKFENDKFYLYGNNFNDKFMENIFSLSKFSGGNLEFFLKGSFDNYSGTFYIQNTTLLDYKVLNNILAFINTVPSLFTFSLPGYNEKGLNIKSAYGKFTMDNGEFNISDLFIDSKEINIAGRGIANVNKDYINMTLNLKTDLGSSAKNIPLVGYILLDKNTVSTTMSLTGKLSNPHIESLLAKDIAIAPFNIIKRTLLLPFNFMENIITDSNSSK